ncbi:transposase [Flavobacteriaceae bacterium (ex Bugula neritina AB1)]|nr:transposase [Flavobacteriaceae bacterium (ex Bugula neritina AB1)]
MYKILDKDTIEMEIVPYIPNGKRGFAPTVPLVEIINSILYKLKTGVQWEYLPVSSLFSDKTLTWQGVYYHFNNWNKSGTFKQCWISFLRNHREKLDLSSVDLDGSHTPSMRGGESVEYQGRKKRKTTNALYLTDRQGIPLAMSEPVAGNHNDLFDIEVQFEEITATLEKAEIATEGLFLNADAGFDSKEFRKCCCDKEIHPNVCFNKRNGNINRNEYFDQELYDQRYAIERTNAWIDSFRSLLNRFDTLVSSWKELNYLAFIVIAIKKINNKKSK